jgi:hypothetical protein
MGIVFPSAAIARRWDGALQSRLRRAPLERFLIAREIAPAPAGIAQASDDIARATVLILDAALVLHFKDCKEKLSSSQRSIVGHVSCVASRALSESISEPDAWRIAALVSTARLLSPWIGLTSAALESASTMRAYRNGLSKPASAIDVQIGQGAATAMTANSEAAMADISARISARLNGSAAIDHGPCLGDGRGTEARS